ncbi:triose-phosphate isomerase [Chitinimonas koreensis]|uniref:triose-phosphate isomerase n=1 Tax=Chitinimonas koreensis TaxID=356302 RepID=UPI000413C227|nr:triose-phosphate isomerase [Chitinimonas koreensis]QNM98083.1 triose-phosphate isomerase [Chitinimonas koreensis]
MANHANNRPRLIVGNWKMNGSLAANAALLDALAQAPAAGCARVVCPPFPYLAQAATLLAGSEVALGAQNCGHAAAGAYTGEVAAPMLAELGCRYVIVGHSERRAMFGDDDARVAAKTALAFEHGLTPILCVGETLAQYEAGQATAVIDGQLDAVLGTLDAGRIDRLVIAYEPIWAIGTGRSASAEQVDAALERIAAAVARHAASARPQLLYGGSVTAATAQWLAPLARVDGVLVGGASLQAEAFLAIEQAFAAAGQTARG